MEAMMAKFMADQERRAQEQDRRVKELEQTIRMIGNQHNPRESVNAITLRGGKQLEMIPAQPTRNSAEKSALNCALDEEETSKEAENREENSCADSRAGSLQTSRSHTLSDSRVLGEIKSS
ncbi:unnamed protein product [Rhodiola kirilowii]